MIKIVALPVGEKLIRLTSAFGMRTLATTKWHSGIDLGIAEGKNVYTVADGTVQVVGNDVNGYGNYVVVDHGDFCTLYAHLKRHNVLQGQKVTAGYVIGLSGNTGSSTGPHLHFEIRNCEYARFWERYGGVYGHCVNPWEYIVDLTAKLHLNRKTALAYIQRKTGFSETTIDYLDSYIYRDDLAIKLAKTIF